MIITHRHPELDEALFHRLLESHADAYDNGKRINQKSHQGVNECHIDGTAYMIKCYRQNSPFACLRFLSRRARVDTSFRYAGLLNTHKVAAAKHLLAIKHLSPLKSLAFLIMEKAPGTPLFQFIQPETHLTLSESTVENIAHLITGLHKLGIAHGDLHTRNLIIAEDDSVQLIDFDNTRKSTNGIQKDLNRFRNAVSATSSYEPAITGAMIRAGHPFL